MHSPEYLPSSTPAGETTSSGMEPSQILLGTDGITHTASSGGEMPHPRYDTHNLQPYGVLLVLHGPDLVIAQVTENCSRLLNLAPEKLLGQPLSRLLGRIRAEALQKALQEQTDLDQNPFFLKTTATSIACEFDAILHRHAGVTVLELEPCNAPSSATESTWLRQTQRIVSQMNRTEGLEPLLTLLIETIYTLTGMARVMAYRFDSIWNGNIFVERCDAGLDSFAGRYFPAGDVSPIVREYYASGQMRYIHDVDYAPTQLVEAVSTPPAASMSAAQAPHLDLQYATLRGATPQNLVSLQYFGVHSVLILPLIANQQLWGLVVCHGYQVTALPYALRRLCLMLTQTAGLMITDRLRAEHENEQRNLQYAARQVFNALTENRGRFEYALPACSEALLASLNASGAVYWNPLDKLTFGTLPVSQALDQLIVWLQQTELVTEDYFATDHIAAVLPGWLPHSELASGMLAIPLSHGWQSGIIWFKPESRHQVIWGHDPTQQHPRAAPGGRYPPNALVEEVCHKSRAWSPLELDAAYALAGLRAHAELKFAEDNLRRSEERYRRLSAQTADWYWEQDEAHRLLHTSNTVWAEHGFNQRTVIGLRRWEMGGVQYDDPQAWQKHIDTLNRHQAFRDFEYAIKLPDGELCWASITGEPIIDGQGKFHGYFGTGCDITLRKKAEQAVAESEARFRVMADNAPVLIWLADEEGRRTYLNQTWLDFTGSTLESQLGYGWLQWVHPEDLPHIERIMQHAVTQRERLQTEYRLRYHDGSYRWVESTAIPRFSEDQNYIGFIGSVVDIHERKRLQLEMLQLNQGLEERVQERTGELEAFAYTISHDLRAPLRSIDGYAALLTEEAGAQLNETGQRYLSRVRISAQQMANLIDALLHFSRYSLRSVERQTTDMNVLLQEVIQEIASPAQQTCLVVKSLPACDADTALIRQVWINLLSNALKFTQRVDAPRIEIGFADGRYYVTDNGIGFDMQYIDKLFGVFNRLHSAQEFEGTGAGLAIVRRIIERHGGTVRAQGQVGIGATFFFTLPAPTPPSLGL